MPNAMPPEASSSGIRAHGGVGMGYKEWGFKSGGTELFNAYSLCHASSVVDPASI